MNNTFNNLLLKRGIKESGTVNFFQGDSKELFQKNLLEQPANWYYRNHEVIYKFNSHKYRCPEFADIDWSNSIIIKGCSMVEGMGLSEEDTLSTRLTYLFGLPVINLGLSGSSVLFTLLNTYSLLNNKIRPKLVIEMYTNLDRSLLFDRLYKTFTNLGIWSLQDNNAFHDKLDEDYTAAWIKHTIVSKSETIKSLFFAKMNEMLWRSANVPLYQASFFLEVAKTLKIKLFVKDTVARDLMHPGRESIKLVAKEIFNEVKSANLV